MEEKFNRQNWDSVAIDELLKQWGEAEKNHRKYQNEWKRHDYYLKAFLTRKLNSLGYEVSKYGQVKRFLEDPHNGNILPANHRKVGKVLKVTCKRDFKVFNYGYGKDGDLMNVEYHNTKLFKKLDEEGYDGVIINDFAQSSYHGNIGHKSVGFFAKAIPDLEIKQIRSQTHPKDEEWQKSG